MMQDTKRLIVRVVSSMTQGSWTAQVRSMYETRRRGGPAESEIAKFARSVDALDGVCLSLGAGEVRTEGRRSSTE